MYVRQSPKGAVSGNTAASKTSVHKASDVRTMSPIKDSTRYPSDWPEISRRIKERAGNRCECEGECGVNHLWQNETQHRHWTMVGSQRCSERHGLSAIHFKGDVVLTVAHLNHTPESCDEDNLKAMCQRCHNRYDRPHRNANAAKTREEQPGLIRLFEPTL